MKILDLLKLTKRDKLGGIWLSGIVGQGEYKRWDKDSKLSRYELWKNGRCIRGNVV